MNKYYRVWDDVEITILGRKVEVVTLSYVPLFLNSSVSRNRKRKHSYDKRVKYIQSSQSKKLFKLHLSRQYTSK